jgi:hypothetical protein
MVPKGSAMTGSGVPLTRERDWGVYTSAYEDSTFGNPPVYSTYCGVQRTTSEGHHWPPRNGEQFSDLGGPFESSRYGISSYSGISKSTTFGNYRYWIRGSIPSPVEKPTAFLSPTNPPQLVAEGTIALSKMRPTAPLSGLGVTLGELREGLPRVVGSGLLKELIGSHRRRRRTLKAGSDEFLSWEFGWKPLVGDLRDAARAVQRSDRIIKQLYRDSGRDVRRRFAFPVSRFEESTVGPGLATPVGNLVLWGPFGSTDITHVLSRYVWVSGMCCYFLPSQDDLVGRIGKHAREANRLLGLRPDPELLWELAPWSWLVDWFFDVGALLGNFSSYAFDGLVWKYAYLMEHVVDKTTYVLRDHRMFDGTSPPCRAVSTRESKVRTTATPFGFGLSLDSFTLRQWAILAALGISRGSIRV